MSETGISSRNLAVDWLKGIMIVCILLCHIEQITFMEHRYLAIDVFFMISGYYLARSYANKPTSSLKYTINRIKHFAPPYFLCVIASLFYRYKDILNLSSFDSITNYLNKLWLTFTMTDELSMYDYMCEPRLLAIDTYIVGGWFIGVLLISGFLIYSMLEYNEKLSTRVLLPSIILLGYFYIFSKTGRIEDWGYKIQVVRGISEVSLGVLLYYVHKSLSELLDVHSILMNILGIVSFILFMMTMFTNQSMDAFAFFTVPFFLICAVSPKCWLNTLLHRLHGGFFPRIGKYSYYLLVSHYLAFMITISILKRILVVDDLPVIAIVAFLLISAFLASYLLSITCDFLKKAFTSFKTSRHG